MAPAGPTHNAGRESPPLDSESTAGGVGRHPIPAIAIVLALAALLAVAALLFFSPFRWHAHPVSHGTRNGGVILSWRRASGARTYGVGFYDAQGRVIDSIEGVETLELVLTRDALPRRLVPGSRVRWAVTAFRATGRAIGRSEPDTLRLP